MGNTTAGGVGVTGATTLTGALDANSTADIADALTLSKATGTGLNVTANATGGGVGVTSNATAGGVRCRETLRVGGVGVMKHYGQGVGVTGATTTTGAADANSGADIADTLTLSKADGMFGLSVTSNATVRRNT